MARRGKGDQRSHGCEEGHISRAKVHTKTNKKRRKEKGKQNGKDRTANITCITAKNAEIQALKTKWKTQKKSKKSREKSQRRRNSVISVMDTRTAKKGTKKRAKPTKGHAKNQSKKSK